MILTDQTKRDFERWLLKSKIGAKTLGKLSCNFNGFLLDWDKLPFSMQYGVYVDWFDSVDLKICLDYTLKGWYWVINDNYEPDFTTVISRNEARIKAIEKATEIYNLKNK